MKRTASILHGQTSARSEDLALKTPRLVNAHISIAIIAGSRLAACGWPVKWSVLRSTL